MRSLFKAVLYLAGALAAFAILAAMVGFLLPGEYSVERSIVIAAPPELIHPHLANLRAWEAWTPWSVDKLPSLIVTYEGPNQGVGATQRWDSDEGSGVLTITESDPTQGISYDMAMMDERYRSISAMHFTPAAQGTQLVWTMEGRMGANPLDRYFGLMMDAMVGPDFEAGLAKLKHLVESTPPADTAPLEATDETT